ncbi:signal peptidase II [Anaerocolumna jejuensis]|uniref:signal peptidase II n=1 Tax=Anaerocolumna jejuensis TaxID=259063 RepID=UPI003F7BE77C
MKKQWIITGLLIALDQLIKAVIWNLAKDKHITLIPGILRFEPFQNTNLNWFASMANVVMPVFIMVIMQLLIAAGIVLFYKYQRYKSAKVNLWLGMGFCLALAGVGCSFIDVVFWGGSLDYIGLLDWFIFDMKDVFLNAGWISLVLWFYSKDYKASENNSITFKSWISNRGK